MREEAKRRVREGWQFHDKAVIEAFWREVQ
jgi:hypothetical protein